MILYPMLGSTSVLVGAVFLASQFPDWAHPLQRPGTARMPSGIRIASGSGVPALLHPQPASSYAQGPGGYGAAYSSPIAPHNPYGHASAQIVPGDPTQHQQYEQYIFGPTPSSASTTNSDGSWPADIPYGNPSGPS